MEVAEVITLCYKGGPQVSNALKQKFGLMPMGPGELVLCYEAIKESGLPEAMQSELTLDALAIETPSANLTATAGVAQDCTNVQSFLTQKELQTLKQVSMWQGVDIVARRMKMLGIENMKEGVKKTACAVLVWLENERTGKMPNGDAVYTVSATS